MLAAGLALVNLWLTLRVGQVRRSERVTVGDGGNDRVIRRMRAHANFAENAPLVAILVAAVELSAGTSPWLWAIAVVFLAARIAHGIGMDGWNLSRSGGTGVTMLIQIALAIWAISIPLTAPRADHVVTVTLPATG